MLNLPLLSVDEYLQLRRCICGWRCDGSRRLFPVCSSVWKRVALRGARAKVVECGKLSANSLLVCTVYGLPLFTHIVWLGTGRRNATTQRGSSAHGDTMAPSVRRGYHNTYLQPFLKVYVPQSTRMARGSPGKRPIRDQSVFSLHHTGLTQGPEIGLVVVAN
jgi:hypothetical protein